MMYTINIKRLLFYFLPPVKRYLPSGEIMLRVRWWHYLFSPVMGLITQYDIRRKKQMLQANTTSEAVVFEHYLREVCQDASIEVHYPGGHGIYAGNETDTFPPGGVCG